MELVEEPSESEEEEEDQILTPLVVYIPIELLMELRTAGLATEFKSKDGYYVEVYWDAQPRIWTALRALVE
jgi:hypothetical protein